MPDRDNWSAGMVLRWLLTNDREAVLSMAEDYGAVLVSGDRITPVRPKAWDDVARSPAINEGLSTEERAKITVLRATYEVIPAIDTIYEALRRGDLDAFARPNGSGDIARIEPIQWAGLRIHCLDGHDIAVPVDSERNPLPLLRPLADYLSGLVPPTSLPTVWPDPIFAAEQAMRLRSPATNASVTPAPPQAPQPRGGYFGALEEFIARFKPEAVARMSDDAVARQFVEYCEGLIGTGRSAPPLPRDRRNIARQVEKICHRLAAIGGKTAAPKTT